MQITIIGEIFQDRILPYNGKLQTGWGGILYNLLTLANLSSPDTVLYPVSHLQQSAFNDIKKLCRAYPQVCMDSFITISSPNNTAELVYLDPVNRRETIEINQPSIGYTSIAPYLKVDGILVNFTARRDIQLEILRRIHFVSPALIMMDLHNLSTRINRAGLRVPTSVSHWKDWVQCADIIQGNLSEWQQLTGQEAITLKELTALHQDILQQGVSVTLTTLADEGVLVSWRENQQYFTQLINGIKVDNIIDPTGCGDVFAAAFFWKYLKYRKVLQATRFANRAAAEKCRLRGLKELSKLRQIRGR